VITAAFSSVGIDFSIFKFYKNLWSIENWSLSIRVEKVMKLLRPVPLKVVALTFWPPMLSIADLERPDLPSISFYFKKSCLNYG
jgi:hypothetical protein